MWNPFRKKVIQHPTEVGQQVRTLVSIQIAPKGSTGVVMNIVDHVNPFAVRLEPTAQSKALRPDYGIMAYYKAEELELVNPSLESLE